MNGFIIKEKSEIEAVDMEFNVENQKRLTRWVLTIATGCILIYLSLKNVSTIAGALKWVADLLLPLSMGMFFALILDVPIKFFETHMCKVAKKERTKKLMRPLAMILSILLILAILAGIIVLVIPELVEAIKMIVEGVTDIINSVSKAEMPEIVKKIPYGENVYDFVLNKVDFAEIGTTLENWLKEKAGTIVNTAVGTVSSIVTLVMNFIIAIIFAIYILANKVKLKAQIVRLVNAWLPGRVSRWGLHAASVGLSIFRNFVSGQTIEAIILGTLCIIGMLILRIPYAATVGVLVGVTAFIPVVGALIGTVVGAFLILIEDPGKALIFVIFLLILQQIEGNIIYPKVMGGKVNLPAMWVLAAVTIGGGVAGPLGMLLGVPVTSTIYVLAREMTENREKKLSVKENPAKTEKTEDNFCEEETE